MSQQIGTSSTTPPSTSTSTATNTIYYSKARSDRSGAFIQDMLMAHAYTYHKNITYGGACITNAGVIDWSSLSHFGIDKLNNHINLLNQLTLYPHILNIINTTCPSNMQYPNDNDTIESLKEIDMQNALEHHPTTTTRMLNRIWYIANDTQIFTSDYIRYLHNLMHNSNNSQQEQSPTLPSSSTATPTTPKPYTIAVHIRRGDIGPCRPRTRGYHRYLPNSHYLRLIERYKPKDRIDDSTKTSTSATTTTPTKTQTRIIIYSESESFESFDDFTKLGYDVVLDGNINIVWKGLLDSNVMILSRSSFSLVPGILLSYQNYNHNHNEGSDPNQQQKVGEIATTTTTANNYDKKVVVYTPFWHEPLQHWDVVDEIFMNQTLLEYKQIKQTHCPKKGLKKKLAKLQRQQQQQQQQE